MPGHDAPAATAGCERNLGACSSKRAAKYTLCYRGTVVGTAWARLFKCQQAHALAAAEAKSRRTESTHTYFRSTKSVRAADIDARGTTHARQRTQGHSSSPAHREILPERRSSRARRAGDHKDDDDPPPPVTPPPADRSH